MDAISGGIQSLDLDEKPKATTASSGTAGDDHEGAGSLRLVENAAETGSGRGETEDGRQEENVEQKLETDGDGGKKGSDVGKVGPLTEEEEEEDDKVLLYRQRYGKKGSEVNRDAGKVAPLPEEEEEGMKKVLLYPQRYGELDCAYYMKTGRCAYGVNCRFNHPPRTGENNQVTSADSSEPVQAANNMLSEEHLEGQQVECRYYLMPGGCKFGKACRYGHSRQMPEEQSVMLNFLGLPLRPGQKECPYYMRSGSCRFSSNCRFNHPDPIAAERRDSPSGYQNAGGSHHYVSISSRPPSNFSQGTLSRNVSLSNASPSYLPSLPSQPKGLGLNPKVKDYQPHAKPSFSSTSLDGTAMNFENYANKHLQMEYPERPGQPECPYFMKTKDCKFRSACKFHHPRSRLSEVSICNLSSCGLPLRPDKEICAFYGRFGICKYGPACKFHHPLDFTATSTAAKSSGDSSGSDNYRIEEVRMGDNKNLVEQSA